MALSGGLASASMVTGLGSRSTSTDSDFEPSENGGSETPPSYLPLEMHAHEANDVLGGLECQPRACAPR